MKEAERRTKETCPHCGESLTVNQVGDSVKAFEADGAQHMASRGGCWHLKPSPEEEE